MLATYKTMAMRCEANLLMAFQIIGQGSRITLRELEFGKGQQSKPRVTNAQCSETPTYHFSLFSRDAAFQITSRERGGTTFPPPFDSGTHN